MPMAVCFCRRGALTFPKFASNNRQEDTAEENKAVVQGNISYFGTYTVDEAAKILIFHIESCSFPNWNGTDQKRSFRYHRGRTGVERCCWLKWQAHSCGMETSEVIAPSINGAI
jgi:hypothetical protein